MGAPSSSISPPHPKSIFLVYYRSGSHPNPYLSNESCIFIQTHRHICPFSSATSSTTHRRSSSLECPYILAKTRRLRIYRHFSSIVIFITSRCVQHPYNVIFIHKSSSLACKTSLSPLYSSSTCLVIHRFSCLSFLLVVVIIKFSSSS